MPDNMNSIARITIPYTNEHFVAFCEQMLSQPYWYGTVVYKCTESLRSRKAKQYPSHYKDNRTARYKQDISAKKVCADCVGLIKGYQWTYGGVGVIESIGTDKKITSKYGNHGCPDRSAAEAKASEMAGRARSGGSAHRFTARRTGAMSTVTALPTTAPPSTRLASRPASCYLNPVIKGVE